MMNGEPKQIGVCDLIVARQVRFQIASDLGKAEIIRPEFVSGAAERLL